MIINFLGDSITEGVGASCEQNRYIEKVASKLNVTCNNYGISGTRIARNKKITWPYFFDMDYQLRAPMMMDSDLVIVFGGTNDWGHGDASIGEIEDKDPYTFCGGLNNLIEILLKKYKKEQIIFMLPLHRFGDTGDRGDSNKPVPTISLEGYKDIMQKILDKNNINYIDLWNKGPKDLDKYFADGVHPNDEGHEILANVIVDYLKTNKFVK